MGIAHSQPARVGGGVVDGTPGIPSSGVVHISAARSSMRMGIREKVLEVVSSTMHEVHQGWPRVSGYRYPVLLRQDHLLASSLPNPHQLCFFFGVSPSSRPADLAISFEGLSTPASPIVGALVGSNPTRDRFVL